MWRHRPLALVQPHRSLMARRRKRGAAMVEAMLVLPILIIVLTGATYLRELYLARASTRLVARACAWEMAMRGCEGGTPASCTASASAPDTSGLPSIPTTAKAEIGGSVDPFSDFPILGEAFVALFGTSTHATASAQVPFPFDEARVGVASSETTVACNSLPRSVLEMATQWLEKVLP
jgi:Flp pilus assembly protein TadG